MDAQPTTLVASPTDQHILDARQSTREWLEEVRFPRTAELKATPLSQLPKIQLGKRLSYLFYEPSTRTRTSFETAVTLLDSLPCSAAPVAMRSNIGCLRQAQNGLFVPMALLSLLTLPSDHRL